MNPVQPDVSLPKTKAIRRYRATLTQSGTGAPVATVYENSLGGDIVWTRLNVGVYKGTLAGVFRQNKTFITLGNAAGGLCFGGGEWNDDESVFIQLMNTLTQVDSDNSLFNTPIEISVYQ